MPNPYKARVDVRRFLNFPGFHSGADAVAYVEDTSGRELTKRDPSATRAAGTSIRSSASSSRSRTARTGSSLEFELDSELDVENSLHKVDTLVAALAELRAGLVEEARLYCEREPEVERLNRREAQRRPRRRARQ